VCCPCVNQSARLEKEGLRGFDITPVGVPSGTDFRAGSATLTYRIASTEPLDFTVEAFFQTVRGGLVVSLYNQKEVWPLFGYEGESYSKGGYIDRGFDDIAWL